jgi:glycosyltransferase involved in cell wall biosynthesis
MKISVVVPFYNEKRYIGDCIEALLAQDYPEAQYEIILVDNNSSDGSREIVQKHERIKLLSENRQGDFAARNRGLEEAGGGIIAFTDSNCAPSKDWLQKIETAMLPPDVGIVLGSLQFATDRPILSMLADYESEKTSYIFSTKTKELYVGYTSNLAIRRSLFDRLGAFAPVYRNSDIVFVRRAVDEYSCDVIRYVPQISVRHLEILNLRSYFRKVSTYGKDFQRYGEVISVRPLKNAERLMVFKRTLHNRKYPLLKAAYLFMVLSVGGVCYELSRWSQPRLPLE